MAAHFHYPLTFPSAGTVWGLTAAQSDLLAQFVLDNQAREERAKKKLKQRQAPKSQAELERIVNSAQRPKSKPVLKSQAELERIAGTPKV